MAPEQQGLLRYACDGLLVAVSVQDPFGSFELNTILSYLERGYQQQANTGHHHKGGAGHGLFQIIESADLLIINVKPHIKTEVIVIFNIDPNKPKNTKATSFHYFSH